jgi:hypothetical protein
MIKQEIYPKTTRIGLKPSIIITEKVDGSNLAFYRSEEDLFICQRGSIYSLSEIDDIKNAMYMGLYGWLKEHGQHLKDSIRVNSVICGEWVGMGKLKYDFPVKWLMFAKANMGEEYKLKNIHYEHDLFKWAFVENADVIGYLGYVPIVHESDRYKYCDVEGLNELYDEYVAKMNRNVEGFVVNINGNILKYVRMKNGKLADHHASGEGENK